jgi:hypothetical protein
LSGTGSQRIASTAGSPCTRRYAADGARCPFTISAADQLSRAPMNLPTPEPRTCAVRIGTSPVAPFTRAPARGGNDELGTDAGAPLPETPAPSSDAIGRRITNCDNVRPLVSRAEPRFARPVTRASLLGVARAGRACRWCPLSHLRRHATRARQPEAPRAPSSRRAPTPRG